jgi:hypothetical protein
MVSQPSMAEESHNAIIADGFYLSQDTLIGQTIEQRERNSIPSASAAGLQLCKSTVLDHQRIRPALDSFFEWFGLGLYRSLGARPGDYCFRISNAEPDVDALIVHLFCKGSKIELWSGSHRHRLVYHRGENNLWLVPRASLRLAGLQPTTVAFPDGGFAIVDARVPLTIIEGNTITFGFGTKDVLLNEWMPMEIPRTPGVEQTIASMRIGVNVKYIKQIETP